MPSVVGFQCPTPSPPSSQLLPECQSQPGPQPCDSTSFLAHALFPRRCELLHLPFALYPTRRPLISPNSDASAVLSSPLIQKHQATCLARGPLSGTSPRPLRALLPRAPRHRPGLGPPVPGPRPSVLLGMSFALSGGIPASWGRPWGLPFSVMLPSLALVLRVFQWARSEKKLAGGHAVDIVCIFIRPLHAEIGAASGFFLGCWELAPLPSGLLCETPCRLGHGPSPRGRSGLPADPPRPRGQKFHNEGLWRFNPLIHQFFFWLSVSFHSKSSCPAVLKTFPE